MKEQKGERKAHCSGKSTPNFYFLFPIIVADESAHIDKAVAAALHTHKQQIHGHATLSPFTARGQNKNYVHKQGTKADFPDLYQ